MSGRYEPKEGGTEALPVWYFVLKEEDGRTLTTSELYDSRAGALADIVAMRMRASTLTVNDLTQHRASGPKVVRLKP